MRVISVNVGRAVDAGWAGKLGRTAIDKKPVTHRVPVSPGGLAGDERADLANHGDPTHAVYAYAREDYAWWEGELGRPLRDGEFGENFTTSGIDVNGAVLGERWRVGSALLEVSGPRIPCVVFRNWMDEKGWVKRFTEVNRTGAYLSVVENGDVGVQDEVTIVDRPDDSVSVAESVLAYHGDKDALARILAYPGHSPFWDERAARLLG
ncbi:MOSC domain-containing protein [Nonomuraea typhae]|uniref:MOSC domain-containing protein n=1 Tax=Nonomuraea typhae TaxID=2603600 RepID=A0ABW7YR67_9ACTN